MKLYNIEVRKLKKSQIYYLKKAIRVNDTVYSIRINLGKETLNPKKIQKLESTPNLELEKKILEKRIHLTMETYKPQYLESKEIERLEKTKYWTHFFNLFLTQSEQIVIGETQKIEYIHGTTAIEGNTFTLQQVDDLLNKELIPSSKTLREINEIQNYLSVEKYLNNYSGKVTTHQIKKIHKIIMDNVFFESAGEYRRIDSIGIRGVDQAVTPAILIETELENIITDYYTRTKLNGHPFEEAILFHYKFEMIHPFIDGNGRVGRELLNYMLKEYGFPQMIIPFSKREQYINALQRGNKGQNHKMIQEFLKLLEDKRKKIFQEIQAKDFRTTNI